MDKPICFAIYLFAIVALFFSSSALAGTLQKVEYIDTSDRTLVKRNPVYDEPKAKCKCSFASAVFGADNRDPNQLHGTITFFQNPCGQTTIRGEFSSGFQDKTPYNFQIVDPLGRLIYDFTPLIKFDYFNNGSLLPFTATTRKISLNCPNASGGNQSTEVYQYGGGSYSGIPSSAPGGLSGAAGTPTVLNQRVKAFQNNGVGANNPPVPISRNGVGTRP